MTPPESDLSPAEIMRLEFLLLADEARRSRNAGRSICTCKPLGAGMSKCYACGAIERAKVERENPSVTV